MSEISLFEPKGKDMKTEYPELATIEEFVVLRDAQLRFVWFFACMSSDIINLDKKERVKIALDKSKHGVTLQSAEKQEYLNLRFPPEMASAIKRMELFQPNLRARTKDMRMMMFENLEEMITLPAIENKTRKEVIAMMDITERKNYASLVKETTTVIEELIPQIEQSGVVKKKQSTKEKTGPTYMDIAIGEGN